MRDIRPTEVQDWKLCPQFWSLKHVEGWKPKTVHKWEVQAWIGTAIHAGITAWVNYDPPDSPPRDREPSEVAQATLQACHAEALAQGREVPSLEEAFTSVRVNTKKFCMQAPEWLQGQCRGTEVALGSARCDWIGYSQVTDTWLVVDFKTKRTKPRNLEAYQWGLRRSWQFAEYVDRVRTDPQSPAYHARSVTMEVQTIILDAFQVLQDVFTPVQFSESERHKIQMEMTTGVVWRNEHQCRNWFGGDCPFLRACWEYDLDHQRMAVDYVQVPPQGDQGRGSVS